jgi:hypothetical protein
MRKVLERRGWGADGLVRTKIAERSQPASHENGQYTVANDVVEREIIEFCRRKPEAAPEVGRNRERTFHEMREFLSGRGKCPLEGYKEPPDGRAK